MVYSLYLNSIITLTFYQTWGQGKQERRLDGSLGVAKSCCLIREVRKWIHLVHLWLWSAVRWAKVPGVTRSSLWISAQCLQGLATFLICKDVFPVGFLPPSHLGKRIFGVYRKHPFPELDPIMVIHSENTWDHWHKLNCRRDGGVGWLARDYLPRIPGCFPHHRSPWPVPEPTQHQLTNYVTLACLGFLSCEMAVLTI